MRKASLWRLVFFAAALVLLQGAQCPQIPELQDVELTIIAEDYIELTFIADGTINVHSGAETIDIEDLRQKIDDAGVDIEDVDSLWVSQVLYGVTAYNEGVDDRWIEHGTVTISRTDEGTSAVVLNDFSAEVYPLLGQLVAAPFEPGAITYTNDLLADVLAALKSGATQDFVVTGEASGESVPTGRPTDFVWRVRVYFQIAGRTTTELPRL